MEIMKFAPMKEILKLAEEQQVAYGAYVTVSYETALAAIEAGSELNCPVIFITGTDCCDLMGGFEGTVETVKRAAANAQIPIALHWTIAVHMKNVLLQFRRAILL